NLRTCLVATLLDPIRQHCLKAFLENLFLLPVPGALLVPSFVGGYCATSRKHSCCSNNPSFHFTRLRGSASQLMRSRVWGYRCTRCEGMSVPVGAVRRSCVHLAFRLSITLQPTNMFLSLSTISLRVFKITYLVPGIRLRLQFLQVLSGLY